MVVTFYNFVKKKNSTAIPTGAGSDTNFVYKDTTDYHNPTLVLQGYDKNWTYAKIADIYFYISAVHTSRQNVWEISLTIDLLGTYRDQILATSAFVAYSTSKYNNDVPDTRIPVSGDLVQGVSEVTFDFIDYYNGMYAFTTIGNGQSSYSAFSTTYITSGSPIFNVAQSLLFVEDVDVIDELNKFFTKPMQAAVGLKWLPVLLESATPDLPGGTIKLGKWDSGQPAWIAGKGTIQGVGNMVIPWQYNDWRNLTPYTTVTVYLPFYGAVPFEASMLYGVNQLQYNYSCDYIAGELAITLSFNKGGANFKLFSCNIPIGVDLPLGQTNTQVTAGLAGLGTAVLGGVTGNIPLALGGLGSAFVAGMSRSYSGTGGVSGGKSNAQLNSKAYCIVQSNVHTMSAMELLGRPLGTIETLNTLSGYCQTVDVSVRCSAFDDEVAQINATLNSGFYIE